MRGKYAAQYKAGTNLILLALDVARASPDERAVNAALRLVMQLAKIPSAIMPIVFQRFRLLYPQNNQTKREHHES